MSRRLTVFYMLEVFNLTSDELAKLTDGLTWQVDSTRTAARRHNQTMDQVNDTLWYINLFLRDSPVGVIITPTYRKTGNGTEIVPIFTVTPQEPWELPN